MKISEKIKWMEPLIKKACAYYEILLPDTVRVYTPRKDKIQDTLATVTYFGQNKFRVVIQLFRKKGDGKLRLLSNRELLHSLAHELAHMKHWDHGTSFKKLTIDIRKFFRVLTQNIDSKVSNKSKKAKNKMNPLLKNHRRGYEEK